MVTAIVSPTARPRPRIMAPAMPGAPFTRTTKVVSHLVAPRASAASRCVFGTAERTSRAAADKSERSELPLDRIPFPAGKKAKPELANREHRVRGQRYDHGPNDQDHRKRDAKDEDTKDRIAGVAGRRQPATPARER